VPTSPTCLTSKTSWPPANPASAAFAGYEIRELKSNNRGTVDLSTLEAALVLCAGGAAALAAAYIPPFARLFLDRDRADAEVRQYADAMFLARGLHGTAGRVGILLLVSLFEREVAIRCDQGVTARAPDAELQPVIAAMAPPLRRGAVAHALLEGLAELERRLRMRGFPKGGPDEIADELVQEKGR